MLKNSLKSLFKFYFHKILQAYVIFDTNSEKLCRFKFECKNFEILPKYGISKAGRFSGKLYKLA